MNKVQKIYEANGFKRTSPDKDRFVWDPLDTRDYNPTDHAGEKLPLWASPKQVLDAMLYNHWDFNKGFPNQDGRHPKEVGTKLQVTRGYVLDKPKKSYVKKGKAPPASVSVTGSVTDEYGYRLPELRTMMREAYGRGSILFATSGSCKPALSEEMTTAPRAWGASNIRYPHTVSTVLSARGRVTIS